MSAPARPTSVQLRPTYAITCTTPPSKIDITACAPFWKTHQQRAPARKTSSKVDTLRTGLDGLGDRVDGVAPLVKRSVKVAIFDVMDPKKQEKP